MCFCLLGKFAAFLITASKHVITKHQTGNNNQDGKKAVAHKKHDTHTNANPEQNKTNQPFHTAPSQKKIYYQYMR